MHQVLDGGGLSWPDTLKLIVPVVSALGLIWVKHVHDRRAERRVAEACLVHGLSSGPLGPKDVIDYLTHLIGRAKAGLPISFHLELPAVLLDAAQRLSTLDPERSFLYTDFVGQVAVMHAYSADLKALLAAYSTAFDEPSPRLISSISWQAQNLGASLLECFQRELSILSAMQKRGSVKVTSAMVTAATADLAEARVAFQSLHEAAAV